ncbi:MAG: hypothetical protein ACJKTH_03345 [Patescibacteria group bacterium UBA2163]
MITDFPEAKKQAQEALNKVLQNEVRQKTVVGNLVNNRVLYEGDKMGVVQEDGKHEVSDLQHAESSFTVEHKEIPEMTGGKLLEKVDAVSEEMVSQMERGLLNTMFEATEKSGNVIKSDGEFSQEMMLAMLEKLPAEFEDDDRNKPIRPFMVVSPEQSKKIKQLMEAETEEDRQAFHEKEKVILDRKYKEYMDDVNSRKIVD